MIADNFSGNMTCAASNRSAVELNDQTIWETTPPSFQLGSYWNFDFAHAGARRQWMPHLSQLGLFLFPFRLRI